MDWLGAVDSLEDAEYEFWLVWILLALAVLAVLIYR